MQTLTRFVLTALLVLSAVNVQASSSSPDTDWPAADAGALGWRTDRLDALDAAIAGGEAPDTTSVLVVHRGALIHEAYSTAPTGTRCTTPAR